MNKYFIYIVALTSILQVEPMHAMAPIPSLAQLRTRALIRVNVLCKQLQRAVQELHAIDNKQKQIAQNTTPGTMAAQQPQGGKTNQDASASAPVGYVWHNGELVLEKGYAGSPFNDDPIRRAF